MWIDYFNGIDCPETDRLHELLAAELVVVGDLILLEILQGFRTDGGCRTARGWLVQIPFAELGGRQVALAAAGNYRRLRRKGVTVHKTIDVVIATYCILNRHPLLYTDRDFDPMVDHLGLTSALAQ